MSEIIQFTDYLKLPYPKTPNMLPDATRAMILDSKIKDIDGNLADHADLITTISQELEQVKHDQIYDLVPETIVGTHSTPINGFESGEYLLHKFTPHFGVIEYTLRARNLPAGTYASAVNLTNFNVNGSIISPISAFLYIHANDTIYHDAYINKDGNIEITLNGYVVLAVFKFLKIVSF